MPSATATLGFTLTNWGPLPTSLTLPQECSSNIALAETDIPHEPFYQASCSNFLCLPGSPNADELESITRQMETPSLGRLIAHYSPATACPGGWKTVGVAARRGESVSRSGWFETAKATATGDDDGEEEGYDAGPTFASYVDILPVLLDQSETAVQCCPSSMTIFQNGYCYSTLPDYTPSTACHTFYTTDDFGPLTTAIPNDSGDEITSEMLFFTLTGTGMVETITIAPSETESYIAYSQVPPLMLLHKPTDLSGDDVGDSEVNDEVEDPDETNAAVGVRVGSVGSGPWGTIGAMLGSSLVAGAAMVLLR
ncbi:hypothetical protein BDV12DRAFT_178214 [Aspergillus spectabilis]